MRATTPRQRVDPRGGTIGSPGQVRQHTVTVLVSRAVSTAFASVVISHSAAKDGWRNTHKRLSWFRGQ
jgi:hypothetical protein